MERGSVYGEGECIWRGAMYTERGNVYGEGECTRRGGVYTERGNVHGEGEETNPFVGSCKRGMNTAMIPLFTEP